MTSGADEWIEKAVPAGSGRYYALLHSDPELQQRQQLASTLISIFSKLGFQSREIEIAKHKLEWWRCELEKETFQHPVMVALSNASPTPQTRQRLQLLLVSYGMLLQSGSPSTDNENKHFHLHTGAGACHLLCEVDSEIAVLNSVGTSLSRLRCYRHLRLHIENGLLCIPMSTLESASISPADLTPDSSNDKVSEFLKAALSELEIEMHDSVHAMREHVIESQTEERRKYKALYIYMLLQIKLLQVIRKDGSELLDKEIRLTPIRNYWHALQAARQFDKLANKT